jgi:hypothetical protein
MGRLGAVFCQCSMLPQMVTAHVHGPRQALYYMQSDREIALRNELRLSAPLSHHITKPWDRSLLRCSNDFPAPMALPPAPTVVGRCCLCGEMVERMAVLGCGCGCGCGCGFVQGLLPTESESAPHTGSTKLSSKIETAASAPQILKLKAPIS